MTIEGIYLTGGDDMREDLGRYNVVLKKKDHERYVEHATEKGFTFSQLARMALNKEIEGGHDGNLDSTDLRHISEKQEEMKEKIERIDGKMNDTKKDVDAIKRQILGDLEEVADAVSDVLKKENKALTVPEINRRLPQYSLEKIKTALEEELRRGDHVVNIAGWVKTSGKEIPKWKTKGGRNVRR